MDENKSATETNAPAIAPEEKVTVLPETETDYEAKNIALEAEKSRLIEERENYKIAYLKEKKKKENFEDEDTDDERLRSIAREELANSRLAEIAQEQDLIIKKALKENKELKLAQLSRNTTPPAAVGAHSESQPVKDTIITPEQRANLPKNWTDKDIERYKKNLLKYGGR